MLAILAFLAEHADLITDIYDFIKSGGSKDNLKKMIADAKVQLSDEAMKEELGLKP